MKLFSHRNRALPIIIPVLLLALLLGSVFDYFAQNRRLVKESIYQTLDEAAALQLVLFHTKIDDHFSQLYILADHIGQQGAELNDDVRYAMGHTTGEYGYHSVALIAAEDGSGRLAGGSVFSAVGREYFARALAGERYVEYIDSSRGSGSQLILLSVPVYVDGAVAAVLTASFDMAGFAVLMESKIFEGRSYSYMLDSDGLIIMKPKHESRIIDTDNALSFFKLAELERGVTAEDIAADLKAGVARTFTYEFGDELRYATYNPAGINDWFIFNVATEEVMAAQSSASNRLVTLLSVKLLLIFAALLFYIWLRELGNRRVRALRAEEYRIAAGHSEKIIMRYDIQRQTARYATGHAPVNVRKRNMTTGIPHSVIAAGLVAEESVADYLEFYAAMSRGEPSGTGTFRMLVDSDEFAWFHADYTLINENGAPRYAVISFYDVTEQREKEIAYEMWRRSVESLPRAEFKLYECNLTQDVTEREAGDFMDWLSPYSTESFNECTARAAEACVHPQEQESYIALLDREWLLAQYYQGHTEVTAECRMRGGGEEYRWVQVSVQMALYPYSNDVKAFLLYRDIDERKQEELALIELSETDQLTRVLNRATFVARTEKLLAESGPSAQHAFLFLDIDLFKQINDTLGHAFGDQALIELAGILRSSLRQGDLLGRLGGDEFMICLEDVPSSAVIEIRARQIVDLARRRLNATLTVSVSMGISVYPRDGLTFGELYEKADAALYFIKESGGNGFAFYHPDMERERGASLDSMDDPALYASDSPVTSAKTMLIVDDSEVNRLFLARIFHDEFHIFTAENGEQALRLMRRYGSSISVLLLDIIMPVMDGIEVLRRMREEPAIVDIPVVVVSGSSEEEIALEAIALGAADYVAKPVEPRLIRVRVSNAIVRAESERLRAQNSYLELQSAEEARYRYIAEHDQLTGLLNRTTFMEKTAALLKNRPDERYMMARMDIERFKIINELFGHAEGDLLLRFVGQTLQDFVGHEGLCCRLSADFFAVCMRQSEELLPRLLTTIREALAGYGLPFEIAATFGIYYIDDKELSVDAMLDRAALAHKTVKGNYLRRFAIYDDTLREAMLHEQEVVGRADAALEAEEFDIYLQPQYDHAARKIVGAEALVRWIHPNKGVMSPEQFIPIFEKNGFISKLDHFVWEKTCQLLQRWGDEGRAVLPVSVNISRLDIYRPNLCDHLTALVARYGVGPGLLKLEITESAYVENPKQLIEVVVELQRRGFTIEMDDFGSGYSSLNSLKDVPVDILKMDMKFLSAEAGNPRTDNILKSVIDMAHSIGLEVIAEGVESEAQADHLLNLGCHIVQGYYYARPMPVEEFEQLALL